METLEEYYIRTNKADLISQVNDINHQPHFNIFSRYNCYCSLQYCRIDYYKIMLTHGKGKLISSTGEIVIESPTLIFLDNTFEFGWETINEGPQDGFTCLFNDFFITPDLRKLFNKIMMNFQSNKAPLLTLTEAQYQQLKHFFDTLCDEHKEYTAFREDLLRNLLTIIITTGLKWLDAREKPNNSSAHSVFQCFHSLLESQFPIDNPIESVVMKKPADYASELNVHVNHLNFLTKKHTGKTTSTIIQERMLVEATNLLMYSNWQISEIAYALGFVYPQHFTNLFKNHFKISPAIYRKNYFKKKIDY